MTDIGCWSMVELIEKLQEDLDAMGNWCRNWDTGLNVEKCKVMHFRKSKQKKICSMTDESWNRQYIEKTQQKRELGVIIRGDLKWSGYADRVVGKKQDTMHA